MQEKNSCIDGVTTGPPQLPAIHTQDKPSYDDLGASPEQKGTSGGILGLHDGSDKDSNKNPRSDLLGDAEVQVNVAKRIDKKRQSATAVSSRELEPSYNQVEEQESLMSTQKR